MSKAQLRLLEQLTTEQILGTLSIGKASCLKARPDGTILDGHHRIRILKARGVDVDRLPIEVVAKTDED